MSVADSPTLMHWLLGVLTVISALSVVCLSNAVVSAMWLMTTLFLSGALYFALGAPFIGAAQILIYAGAISVLFVFIIMLLDLKPLRVKIPGRNAVAGIGILLAIVFLCLVGSKLIFQDLNINSNTDLEKLNAFQLATQGKNISLKFISTYMIPFQATGFLILSAVMGVIVVGRPKKKPEGTQNS